MKRAFLVVCVASVLSCSMHVRPVDPKLLDLSPEGVRNAGAINLATLDGRKVTFADCESEVTVVAFWALWCKPCVQELPYLEKLYQQFRRDPVVSIVAVNIDEFDSTSKVKETVQNLGLSVPVLLDPEQRLYARLGNFGVPIMLFIDRNQMVLRKVGFPPFIGHSGRIASVEEFLPRNQQIIELAKRGSLPSE